MSCASAPGRVYTPRATRVTAPLAKAALSWKSERHYAQSCPQSMSMSPSVATKNGHVPRMVAKNGHVHLDRGLPGRAYACSGRYLRHQARIPRVTAAMPKIQRFPGVSAMMSRLAFSTVDHQPVRT